MLRHINLLLQNLSKSKSITKCKQIHSKLTISNAIADIYYTNSLLNFYSRCSELVHARLLFDKSPQRNVVTWTSLITAYFHHGFFEKALKVFKEMVKASEKPNQFTFSVTIRVCTSLHLIEMGVQIHGLIIRFGLERDEFAGSSLVDMYHKMGSLDSAFYIFTELFYRDLVSWNVMIYGFAKVGDSVEVMKLFKEMLILGLNPNGFTLTSMLKCCCCLREVEQIHGFVFKSAIDSDTVLASALVDVYGKCGNMDYGLKILNTMAEKDDFVWSSVMSGHTRNGNGKEAVLLFREMCRRGVRPDQHALSSAFKACVEIREVETGTQIHSQMIKQGYQRDCFVASALLILYSDFSKIYDVEKVFRRISDKDIVSWNSMITGYAQTEGFALACMELFREFVRKGVMKPDGFTFIAILKSCQSASDLDTGLQIHTQIVKSSHSFKTHVENAVINMYSKCNAVNDSRRAFDSMVCKDDISWSSIIGSYVHNGIELEALKIGKQMLATGFPLNSFSFPPCLAACSSLVAMDLGKQFHSSIIKSGFMSELHVGSSVIDMYAKCGNMEDSLNAFDELRGLNIVTFNSLISGFAHNGRAHEAIKTFKAMEKMNITPNKITFIAVLSACSHAGLVEESIFFFNLMRRKYEIGLESEHFSCLVDLYARAGRIEEACEIFLRNQNQVGVSAWRTLLSACRNYGNVRIAEKAAKRMMELEPDDHASYVLLSNLYSGTGKWEEALKLREKMTEIGVKKDPGSSWVIIKDKVHEFLVGDFSHPEIDMISREISMLNQQMKTVDLLSFSC